MEYVHAFIYLATMIYLAYKNYQLEKGKGRHTITTIALIAFGLNFIGHIVHISELARGKIDVAVLDSVERTFEFIGNFFFFGIVFFRSANWLDKKSEKIEQTLKEVREFTKAFFKISDEAAKSKYLDFKLDLPEIKSDKYLKNLSRSVENMIESVKMREDNVQASSQELQILNEELSSTYEELRHLYNEQEKHLEELKKSQSELIAEKNKVDAILASIGDGISIQDKEFNVIYANDFYTNKFGKRVIGKKCYDVYEKREAVCKGCPLKEAFKIGEVVRTTRAGLDKNDKEFYIDITASPIIDENGAIIGGIEVAKDVTKRVQLEKQLKRKIEELNVANEKLVKMDKIKTNFVGMASHELRTPLTMIKGYAELLLFERAETLDEVNCDMVKNIHTSAERLNEIISDILDVSRIDDNKLRLNKQKNNIVPVIDKSVRDLKPYVDKRVHEIITNEFPEVDLFCFDADRMYQVFSNLIANAIKYTPDGGRIELSLGLVRKANLRERVSDKSALRKLRKKDNDWVEFIIKDNGIGVDLNEQKHIFDRFYEVGSINEHTSSKTAFMGGGAGLGLSICKGIIEAHEGVIWVYSEGYDISRKNGSEFHVMLPYILDLNNDELQEGVPFLAHDDDVSVSDSDDA
jgi:PAS domain S-box-containing protein